MKNLNIVYNKVLKNVETVVMINHQEILMVVLRHVINITQKEISKELKDNELFDYISKINIKIFIYITN